MNSVHRNIIRNKKEYLERNVDLNNVLNKLRNANIFTKSMLCDIENGSMNLFDELTSRGPKAFSEFLNVLREAGYNNLIPVLKPTDPKSCLCQKGQCLLIINPSSSNSYNQCSYAEVEALEDMFCRRWENSCVISLENPSLDSMLQELSAFSRKDFSECDLCVVIILSYGVLYGCHNHSINENQIFNLFSTGSASGIPKLFLLPFCGGESDTLELVCPNGFDYIYIIRWPRAKISDASFGEVLANCFESEFEGKTEINLPHIAKRAYDEYNSLILLT